MLAAFSTLRPVLAILAASLCLQAAAQQGARGGDAPGSAEGQAAYPDLMRVSSNLVMVPVSVTGPEGNLIRSLSLKDFVLEDEERPQPIARLAEPGRYALDLSLLLDISGSMSSRYRFALTAACDFLRAVISEGDRVSIHAIGEEPQLLVARTGQVGAAVAALTSLAPERGTTAFFDAVVAAARLLEPPRPNDTRRVLVVLSDGQENYSSHNGLPEALRALQQADCVFYAINPIGANADLNRVSREGQEILQALAGQTGGMAFLPQSPEELPSIFGRIIAELQAQYLLEYYPADARPDGGFRRIRVRIPSRPELRIRARQGYYARRP